MSFPQQSVFFRVALQIAACAAFDFVEDGDWMDVVFGPTGNGTRVQALLHLYVERLGWATVAIVSLRVL